MKAKIIGTGEIVDVRPNGEIMIHQRCTKYVTEDGRVFFDSELNLPAIDWEQRRYEIAKDILASSFATPMEGVSMVSYIHDCAQWADFLIEELKRKQS